MLMLSKSNVLAYRQCHKRLWLEIHRSDLKEDSTATERFAKTEYDMSEAVRKLYDPGGRGISIDRSNDDYEAACRQTTQSMGSFQPVFGATFYTADVLVSACVMLPVSKKRKLKWKIVEVKSSTKEKEHYHDDIAVLAYIVKLSGIKLEQISVAYIDGSWIYRGKQNYNGLFYERDLTEIAFSREEEIKKWIKKAQIIVSKKHEPKIRTGPHCKQPYHCEFYDYCRENEPQAEYPVSWLPNLSGKRKKEFEDKNIIDMNDVPDELLTEKQQRVKKHTLSGKRFCNKKGAARDLSVHKLPAYFLDFETVQFAVPIWKGSHPYQQIPFQFSLHKLTRKGSLIHKGFLDLSGRDPSRKCAEILIKHCGKIDHPIYTYSGFEKTRIRELAERFPSMKGSLLAINERIVDLLCIAKERYYHPNQEGSWSLKQILPTIDPTLCYDESDEVQDGLTAAAVFVEAIAKKTTPERKLEIKNQLLKYCKKDTISLIALWRFFSGKKHVLTDDIRNAWKS